MYKQDFLERPACVVLNKCDIDAKAEEKLEIMKKFTDYKCFCISAKHGYGLGELIMYCRKVILELR